jgi:hypothetical protein
MRRCLMRYGGRYLQQSCMSVRINNLGTQLVALRRRLPPVLYELNNTDPLCDLDHDGYYNSCTMKSCCFAGPNDEVRALYDLRLRSRYCKMWWLAPAEVTGSYSVSRVLRAVLCTRYCRRSS